MARRKDPNMGCLYFLIALPLAIILLPFRLAFDRMGNGRRRRRR